MAQKVTGIIKLQIPAAGDLDPLHGQLQAVHIVGKILARKVAVQRCGKHKILIRINCVVILNTHKENSFSNFTVCRHAASFVTCV